MLPWRSSCRDVPCNTSSEMKLCVKPLVEEGEQSGAPSWMRTCIIVSLVRTPTIASSLSSAPSRRKMRWHLIGWPSTMIIAGAGSMRGSSLLSAPSRRNLHVVVLLILTYETTSYIFLFFLLQHMANHLVYIQI